MLPSHHYLRQSAASTAGTSVVSGGACSDRREMNEAKVQGILSYLEEVQQHPGGTSSINNNTMSLQQLQQQQQSLLLAQQHSSVSQVAGVAPSPPPLHHRGVLGSSNPTDLGQYLTPQFSSLGHGPGSGGGSPPVQGASTEQVLQLQQLASTKASTTDIYVDPTMMSQHHSHHHHPGHPGGSAGLDGSHFTAVSALTATTSPTLKQHLGYQHHLPSLGGGTQQVHSTTTASQQQQQQMFGSQTGFPSSSYGGGGLSMVDSNVPSVYNGIKGKLQTLKSEAEATTKENERLKDELNTLRLTSQMELKKALDIQEVDFDKRRTALESTVGSHLKHMKTLLGDKEELTTRVKELARQNEEMKNKRESELDKMERKHTKAFSEAKARWESAERSKREKWEEEKTKKIKGTITTTMEPEIQRMISRHKAELRSLEENNADLLKAKQQMLEKKEQELALCQERHSQEIEMVLAREREASRLRLSEEADRSQRSTDHLKAVAQEKVDAAHREVDHLRGAIKKTEEQLLEGKLRERELEHTTQQKILLEVEQIRQAKENQILALKEELMGKRATWAQEHEKTQNIYLQQREAEILKKCENQRDLEIQKVMSEFEKELVQETTTHKAAEKKNREVQSSLTREVDRLKSEHVLLTEQREKSMELLKGNHQESEHLKEEITHLRQELRTSVGQREGEFDRRLRDLDQQWDAKLKSVVRQYDTLGDDLKGQLQRKDAEILQIRTDADTSLRSLEQQQHLELSAINDRILVVVSQKDQTIKQLSEDNQRLQVDVMRVRAEMSELLQS